MQGLPFDVSGVGAATLCAIAAVVLWRKLEAKDGQMMSMLELLEKSTTATERMADALDRLRREGCGKSCRGASTERSSE